VNQPDDAADRLESTNAGRPRTLLVIAVAVLAAAAVAATVVSRSDSRHRAHARPSPPQGTTRSSTGDHLPPAPAAPDDHLWVFFQRVDRCTSTDHRHQLRAALAVTELSDRPLRLVTATVVGYLPGLRLTDVRLGTSPCAETAISTRAPLPSAGEVVAFSFAVGPGCPANRRIGVRMTFETNGSSLVTDTLLDLADIHFVECDARASDVAISRG
jgi:hypothetical protein